MDPEIRYLRLTIQTTNSTAISTTTCEPRLELIAQRAEKKKQSACKSVPRQHDNLPQHATLRRGSYRRPPLYLRRRQVPYIPPIPPSCLLQTDKLSTIRQVPDHQEVYLDKDGFTSIIFDITDRVGLPGSGPATDGAALTTHLEDIIDSDTDTVKVWSTSNTAFSKLPYVYI